ncbi:putative MFS transporter, AGZA family, xanthine/uracil permease [Thermotomaculum hydrothermale]|uniref:Putative MFS transporter, AGZA family, xanthine/uracil permease n=1 Tax=Thermotomaculum hydrothermale TaxID=981385 RepID=A0A7R6PFQ5_9BACT|nr:hypothetical protein [Thermotomaculum hydrothermale]BBB32898.1 putative MFS transporter, AGZA family, xanthine/uracil permease [Thermotomaculum hydrothermale]
MKRIFARGDFNAFFGLMLDNVTNLVVLTGILTGVFGYPLKIIMTRMIPATALGVMIGDLVYTYMAYRLMKKEGRDDVTAMPLGLDTPSTVGITLTVLGPVYLQTKDPYLTLYVGMSVLIIMGIIKVILSFLGEYVQKYFPEAGLLGSIGGIGLALLGFYPMLDVFKLPIVGIVALGIIVYAFFARKQMPFNIPPVFAAVTLGTILFYLLPARETITATTTFGFFIPHPDYSFVKGMRLAINYLPVAIPFGILTIVGGINVNESARLAGDNYKTRNILLTEAIATLIAGFCGGVAQSTPYIGHPAYKRMGARAGYTLATGLFIGIGGMLGIVGGIVNIIPVAAVAPILIFIGFEIAEQSYVVCKDEIPAVLFAFIPSIANLVQVQVNTFMGFFGKSVADLSGDILATYKAITVLGNGFILTAMLWGSMVSFLIRKNIKGFIFTNTIMIVFTLFGLIHSINPNGSIYIPKFEINYSTSIAIGYLIFTVLSVLMIKWDKSDR